MRGQPCLTAGLAALLLAIAATPSLAADGKPDPDDKLPAQLPSVTIQGEDLSSPGKDGQGKLAPTGPANVQRVRLPEPAQRRATSEGNRALMVSVTPSTLEGQNALPQAVMPYTSVLGGYGPPAQFRVGLYDARLWGPAVGITEVDGRSGIDWSGWRGKEWIDWAGVGRLNLEGQGFAWTRGALQGGQSFLAAGAEHGESEDFLARFDLQRGSLGTGLAAASPIAPGGMTTMLARGFVQVRPAAVGDHQPTLQLTAQHRTWGTLSGPEAYALASDFWSLSDAVQLEAGLGGGYWGLEPILDPRVAFHYRPQASTHLFAGLRTQSELPDFTSLYLRRPASQANAALRAERIEGLAELGGSHRVSESLWASLSGALRRSHRHIYWADPTGIGLWTPLNAASEQWSPSADGRLQMQWLPNISQSLGYRFNTVQPLGFTEQRLGTSVDGRFMDQKLGVGLGLEGRWAALSSQQMPGGGNGFGVFAEAELEYVLTKDVSVSFSATDVPLALTQPGHAGANYFVPIPLLSANVQYQF